MTNNRNKLAPKDIPLTHKQAEFVQELLTNPKATKSSAYKKAYNTSNMKPETINREAFATARKPQVMSRLANYNDLVEGAITKTVSDWKDEDNSRKREIAMQNAQYIHDKIHGRSKQQVEVQSQQVTINIDLTGSDLAEPA